MANRILNMMTDGTVHLLKSDLKSLLHSTENSITKLSFTILYDLLSSEDAAPFAHMHHLNSIDMHTTYLTNGFLEAMLNKCPTILQVGLHGCTGVDFSTVRITRRPRKWTLHLENMTFDPLGLADMSEHNDFDVIMKGCTYNKEEMYRTVCKYERLRMLEENAYGSITNLRVAAVKHAQEHGWRS